MSGGGHEAGIDVTLPAILLFLLMGVFAKQGRKYLPSWFQLPYTVIMFLFGVLVTAISTEFHGSIGRIGRSIDLWLGVHPHVILLAFLPPLLFESAFDMDYNVFQRVAGQAMLLAVPGVLLSLGLTAVYVRLFFTYALFVLVVATPALILVVRRFPGATTGVGICVSCLDPSCLPRTLWRWWLC